MTKKLRCQMVFIHLSLQKIKYKSFFRTIKKVIVNFSLNKESMPPLSGIACTTDRHNIYIFGGKNEESRFNDLWMFNLKTLEYELLPANGDVPAVRNGHTMSFYNDRLYVFGGIHDITW